MREVIYLLASFAEDGFDKDKVEDMFTVYGMAKTDYNDDEYEKNIVVLGGCQMPNSYMELIIAAEEELKAEKAERDKKTGVYLASIFIKVSNNFPPAPPAPIQTILFLSIIHPPPQGQPYIYLVILLILLLLYNMF